MKYIISESQYKKLITEDKRRTEFPGLDFFDGEWDFIEKNVDRFTLNGKVYTDINDFKKDYYISGIKEFVRKNNELNDLPEDTDHGISLYELTNADSIRYNDNYLTLISMFYLDEVLVETFKDADDDFPETEDYIEYEDLGLNELEQIYKILALNFK